MGYILDEQVVSRMVASSTIDHLFPFDHDIKKEGGALNCTLIAPETWFQDLC